MPIEPFSSIYRLETWLGAFYYPIRRLLLFHASMCAIDFGFAFFILHKDQLSVEDLILSAISHKLSTIRISIFRFVNSKNKSGTRCFAIGRCVVFET